MTESLLPVAKNSPPGLNDEHSMRAPIRDLSINFTGFVLRKQHGTYLVRFPKLRNMRGVEETYSNFLVALS